MFFNLKLIHQSNFFFSVFVFFVSPLQIQELLSDSEQPVRVELVSLQPADEPNKTTAVLVAFDALTFEENVPLPVEEQLDFIHSLNETDFSVRDGVLYWDGG